MESYFYSTATLQTYSATQMQGLFGINTDTTAISILNQDGFYPVQESSPNFDLKLYDTTSVWNLVPVTGGQGAILVWSPVPKPLPEAKANASAEVKQQADGTVSEILTVNYVTGDVIASVASQDLIDRPASLQVILDETTVVTNNLGAQLDAIAVATTVDELNNIVNPPSGTLQIYRTGVTLDESFYVAFNSVSLTEADTELYIPGSATTITYSGGAFPQTPSAFSPGDYLIQIRVSSSGQVLKEFEVATTPTDVTF